MYDRYNDIDKFITDPDKFRVVMVRRYIFQVKTIIILQLICRVIQKNLSS